MENTTSTSSIISVEAVHPLDLLRLTQWKVELLGDEGHLREVLHHCKLIETIRNSCQAKPRVASKRLRDTESSDFDGSSNTASLKRVIVDKEEPRIKKTKSNFIGPFSSEDFMTHMYPKASEAVPTHKDPVILYRDRLATFKNFRFDRIKNAKCTSETLALAGFISTGKTSAMCPFCSKTKEFKPMDDPWKEHQKMGIRCSFMKIAKSKTAADFGLAQEAIVMASSSVWK